LKKLQVVQEPLQEEQLGAAVTFINNGDIDALRSADASWKSLQARLA
jgi:hypothetical protein